MTKFHLASIAVNANNVDSSIPKDSISSTMSVRIKHKLFDTQQA